MAELIERVVMVRRPVIPDLFIAEKVWSGALDFHSLSELSDAEVIQRLTALDGVGVWTAEMLLLHSLQRSDVLSFGDLGIHRRLQLLYHHREMPRARFDRYRCRYFPYGSVASIYLWALAAGEVEPW